MSVTFDAPALFDVGCRRRRRRRAEALRSRAASAVRYAASDSPHIGDNNRNSNFKSEIGTAFRNVNARVTFSEKVLRSAYRTRGEVLLLKKWCCVLIRVRNQLFGNTISIRIIMLIFCKEVDPFCVSLN